MELNCINKQAEEHQEEQSDKPELNLPTESASNGGQALNSDTGFKQRRSVRIVHQVAAAAVTCMTARAHAGK